MTDAELVQQALRDPDDYALIVKQYEKLIMRYSQKLSRLSQEDAEDITQHVFLKAYQHLNDFDPELKLSNWLLRIAHNEVIDFWRRQKNRPQAEAYDPDTLDSFEFLAVNFGKDFDRTLKAETVQKLLDLLKPSFREVLFLHYFEEKSYEEIADILKYPAGTVAARISRGKKAFAELAARTGEIVYLTTPT